MTGEPDGVWPGCHGVRIVDAPDAVRDALGHARGNPFLDARISGGAVRPETGDLLWQLESAVEADGVRYNVARSLHRDGDGTLLLRGTPGSGIDIDTCTLTLTVEPGPERLARQLLASFGLPLLIHGQPAVILHGSACEVDGRALLVCGESGAGKSSALIALVDAGWGALSEDVCVVDLRDGCRVWPGPPWVRVAHGVRGPQGSRILFDSLDKAAWDTGRLRPAGPSPLAGVVFLDPPAGSKPEWRALTSAEAMAALAANAVWLLEPEARAEALFGRVATLALRVPAARLQLPRCERWRDNLAELLATRL